MLKVSETKANFRRLPPPDRRFVLCQWLLMIAFFLTAAIRPWHKPIGYSIAFLTAFAVLMTINFIALVASRRRLRRRVEAVLGAMCSRCLYPIERTDRGICSECGVAFELKALRAYWREHRMLLIPTRSATTASTDTPASPAIPPPATPDPPAPLHASQDSR